MSNLYNSLFADNDPSNNYTDTSDITMEVINQIHGHLDFDILSNYYDLTSYNKLFPVNDNKLNIVHMNSRSLPKNFDKITAFLSCLSTPPDILAFTETWLTDNNKHLYQLPGYHSYHLIRNTRTQGGVSVFISNKLNTEQLCELTIINEDIEINTIKINNIFQNTIICAIYRPHSKHILVEEFSNILSTLLHKDILKHTKIMIIGDLNINLLEHTTHPPTNNFLINLQALNFFPHISRPTRFPDSLHLGEPSLLDHIYTNFNGNFTSGIIHFPISDHLPVFLNMSIPSGKPRLHKIEFRNLNYINKQLYSDKLMNVNWNRLLTAQNVDSNCNIFINKLHELFSKCFPIITKHVTEKRLCNPWITQAVLKTIKTKNDLYKDFKIGAIDETYYKNSRNTLNAIIKHAKTSYYMALFSNFRNDTRKIWNAINKLKSNFKENDLNSISYNNRILNRPPEIAEAFNEFYTNIAPNMERDLPASDINPIDFLQGDYPQSMLVPPVSPHDVSLVINKLKNKKGSLHEIPVSLIKSNKHILAVPLSLLFNQSITEGKFPQCLKHATVIPIYKKGPKDDIGNYRPISMLSVTSKIFESLMKNSFVRYLEAKSILNSEQYGFRQGLSTFDALNSYAQEIYNNLDKQSSLLSIYVDFTKAFDTVKHDILLYKLNYYGIRGNINNWFKDYLTNRTQSTKVNNNISTPRRIKYGVPQGSVLGPILFLIYINDLPLIFKKLKTKLFADDSTLYISGPVPTDIIQEANNDLNIFYNWCLSNRLTVNLNKTFYMLFTNKSFTSLPPLFFHNNEIQRTTHHKHLGIVIDEALNFKLHISDICHKLSRNVSLLYQVKDLVPTAILKILYNAHILPHLQYCMPIWANTYPSHLIPLFRLQKKILRIITKSSFFDHTQPLFKETQIMKLFDLNKLQIAIYMYKNIYRDTIINSEACHTYPTRTRNVIRAPQHNLTIFQHSMSYMGPKIWNSIPDNIKNLPSLHSFKKHYKLYLTSLY